MRYFTLILCFISIVATALPLIDSAQWWIRIFDFPRAQIAVLCLLSFVLSYFYVRAKWSYKVPLLFLLALALIFQLQMIFVYTPLYPTQAKNTNHATDNNRFSLVVSNVLMDNEDKESFIKLVRKYKPDLLLINEPDDNWLV